MASRILKEFANDVPNVALQIQPGGSTTNIRRLANNRVDMAMTVDFLANMAYQGKAPFDQKPLTNLLYVMKIVPAYFQVLTLKSSEINTFDDLLDKKFACGQANLVTHLLLNMLLEERNVTMDDIRDKGGVVNFVGTGPSTQMMSDNALDAIMMGGNPATHPKFNEVAMTNEITLLHIDPSLLEAVTKKYPVKIVPMPEKTYGDIKGGFPTFATDTILLATDQLSDEAVYLLVKAYFDNLDTIKSDTNQFLEADLSKTLEGNTVPIHPGASRYYKVVDHQEYL